MHGYVISTPWLFVMGRPVDSNDAQYRIVDPSCIYEEFDCWHVYLAAGRIQDLARCLPFPLQWVSFERQNELHVLPLGRFMRLCRSTRPSSS